MRDIRPSGDQFWLLTGTIPAGPFSVSQIHGMLASGETTWQTRACPVGGGAWVALVEMPGFGPTAIAERSGTLTVHPPRVFPVRSAALESPVQNPPPPVEPLTTVPPAATYNFPQATPSEAPTPSKGVSEAVAGLVALVVMIAILSAISYGIYEWLRPPTATEVCKKFVDAQTAADTKKYATSRMHPLIDWMYANKSPDDPNDTFELTQEVDGTKPDTKFVGFKGTWFNQEAAKRIQVEGYFLMSKSDGWKADDFVFTGVEGVSLPAPVSMVDEHLRSNLPAASQTGAKSPVLTQKPKQAGVVFARKNWFDSLPPLWQKGIVLGGIGVAILSALGGLWNLLRGKRKA